MRHNAGHSTQGLQVVNSNVSCKQPAFLSSFSLLQVIQNKRPWCWDAAYVTAGYSAQ